MPLTDMSLRALPFVERQRDFPDGTVPNLYVRVGKRTKTFMLAMPQGGRRRRIRLGHYPHISLANARSRARDLQAQARLAKDTPQSFIFREAREQFLRLHLPTMRPGTQIECSRFLLKRFQCLAERPLAEIKTSELAGLIDRIEKPGERRSAIVWLRVFMAWCWRRGYLDTDPAKRIQIPAVNRRDRVLTLDELRRIWAATFEVDPPRYGALVRLLMLTGQRRAQFGNHFADADKLVFPREIMKSDREHILPLTPLIAANLGNHDLSFNTWQFAEYKKRLDRLCGVPNWVLHDFRRALCSHLADGTNDYILERLIAHQLPGVMRTYNRASYTAAFEETLLRYETLLALSVAPVPTGS